MLCCSCALNTAELCFYREKHQREQRRARSAFLLLLPEVTQTARMSPVIMGNIASRLQLGCCLMEVLLFLGQLASAHWRCPSCCALHAPLPGPPHACHTAQLPACCLQFCKDVEPGQARVKDCLEEHRRELSGPCSEEVDAMVEKRVRDLRLDSRLRSTCENEIFNMCAFQGVGAWALSLQAPCQGCLAVGAAASQPSAV